MPGPEEWSSRRSNPADKIRLTGPAATRFLPHQRDFVDWLQIHAGYKSARLTLVRKMAAVRTACGSSCNLSLETVGRKLDRCCCPHKWRHYDFSTRSIPASAFLAQRRRRASRVHFILLSGEATTRFPPWLSLSHFNPSLGTRERHHIGPASLGGCYGQTKFCNTAGRAGRSTWNRLCCELIGGSRV